MSASPRSPLVEELSPLPDPARCCELLDGLPYRLFLDSASRDRRLGRYSYVTADPIAVVRSSTSRRDPLAEVRSALTPFAAPPVPGLPPFQGGAAGPLLTTLKQAFAEVRHAKPAASRAESAETYVVAKGFRSPAPPAA